VIGAGAGFAGGWFASSASGGPYREVACSGPGDTTEGDAAGSDCNAVTFQDRPSGWASLPDWIAAVSWTRGGNPFSPPGSPSTPLSGYEACRP
jgi:hypothetical protein